MNGERHNLTECATKATLSIRHGIPPPHTKRVFGVDLNECHTRICIVDLWVTQTQHDRQLTPTAIPYTPS